MSRRSSASFEDLAVQRALGERVRRLRKERGWTQENLVERTGLDRSYLAEVEGGNTNPSLRTLSRLAQGLQIELRELFSAD